MARCAHAGRAAFETQLGRRRRGEPDQPKLQPQPVGTALALLHGGELLPEQLLLGLPLPLLLPQLLELLAHRRHARIRRGLLVRVRLRLRLRVRVRVS